MTNDAQTFYVEIFGRYGLLLIVFFAPALWLASDSIWTLSIVIAFLVFVSFSTPMLFTVVVGPNGIVLYRVNRARWQDLTTAKEISFLGLPYLSVERKKGIRWWIPLYLTRPDEFRLALTKYAPFGHPLREYAESNI